ncbi:hypothetical protein [Alcaligenes endophyticus]|uniref:Uncharacterized protein n=1 Tax=Alcaligenes endophyticus TaxID=1929088 RepID=A0ABT8ENM5_9BURK|nr:hypothetical protein [Alcaligenes endophyticus]MCX5592806.1 hypothetical protein [Alcaligenes endophyticus]MDN4122848.1 hypothetical protein [Alcaligenes endophyticus]
MKTIFRDAVTIGGLSSLVAGMYISFGEGAALIALGLLLLLPAAVAVTRGC